ncbi:hypothetical protein Q8E21_004439 [Vibrio vulnificus]|nr:hypothetical protein [Vibrio vulnificus]ELI3524436.1 hypothetical protein [Vibrio vulnificus]
MKYISAIVAVLFVSPMLVKLYVDFVPGALIGSIDGWLGFLGGYSGGLLAFFAAYTIFNCQRKDTVKPFLTFDKASDKPHLGYLILSDPDGKPVEVNESDYVIDLHIKNVGLATAVNIKMFDKETNRPFHFYSDAVNSFIELPFLAHIEVSNSIRWTLQLPSSMCDSGDKFEKLIVLQYQDLYGTTHSQDMVVTFDNTNGHYLVVVRT